ncbi:MAG: inositol monophosphatase family protein [Polyangiaceae bacterium]
MTPGELEQLMAIAHDAGEIITRIYAGEFSVDYKAPSDPVTQADRLANDLICERIALAFPGAPIVAEESAPETFLGFETGARVFFVDPLDGTREFVARNGQFVVMIGVVDGDHATAGVVHAPVTGTTWYGALGSGAWRSVQGGSPQPIRVSDIARPEFASVVSSRSQRSAALQRALDSLGARQHLSVGSAGLKGGQVADGSADAYLSIGRSGKLWDACAVDALVHAAGGRFTDTQGKRLDYRSPDISLKSGILACNEHLHAALLARLVASVATD